MHFKSFTLISTKFINIQTAFSLRRGVARIFQRGCHTGSNNIVMAFSPRNILAILLKKKAYRGGVTGTPAPPPPSYALVTCSRSTIFINYRHMDRAYVGHVDQAICSKTLRESYSSLPFSLDNINIRASGHILTLAEVLDQFCSLGDLRVPLELNLSRRNSDYQFKMFLFTKQSTFSNFQYKSL